MMKETLEQLEADDVTIADLVVGFTVKADLDNTLVEVVEDALDVLIDCLMYLLPVCYVYCLSNMFMRLLLV